MDKFVPQCNPLKAIYDDCMKEWYDKKLLNSAFGAPHPCSDPFQDYKDCVTIGMKYRNSQSGSGSNNGSAKH